MMNKNIRTAKFISDDDFRKLELLLYKPKASVFGWTNEYRSITEDVILLRISKDDLIVDTVFDTSEYDKVSMKRWFPEFKPNTIYIKSGENNPVAFHRYIFGLDKMYKTVDHINNNGRDNRKANLSVVENFINERKRVISSANTSGVMGLVWEGPKTANQSGRWRAKIIDDSGNVVSKSFTLSKYNNDKDLAMKAAIAVLKKSRLNHPHFNYSERGDRERIENISIWKLLQISNNDIDKNNINLGGNKEMAKYDESQIVALDQMTAIRTKLGMYVGSTATPNHIVTELLSNAIDEIAGGFGDTAIVTFKKDGSVVVEDRGRGIPYGEHKVLKMSTLDVIFMNTHTGGKMDNTKGSYKTSIGTHGVGCTVATATCEKMIVDVWRDWHQATRVYSRGKSVGDIIVKQYTQERKTGTRIQYYPDPTKGLWDTIEFDIPAIKTTMKGFSYFFPKAKLVFVDNRGKKPIEITYHSPNGLLDMYKDIAGTEDLVTKDPIRIMSELDGIEDGLDIVFGYTHSYYDRSVGYCNALRLSEGGTHIQGFKAALTKSLNDAARTLQILKPKDMNFKGQELSDGLVAIVSVKLASPKFENQTKTKLSNMDLVGKVSSIVYEYLKHYFEDNPKVVLNICDKLLKMRKAREAAKKARELVLNDNKNKSEFSNSLVGKLATCSSKDIEKNEVILIEGASAGGNVKQARDSKIQAVYALRGKVLNVEKVDMNVAFKNQEIKDLISILGCGINEDFDMNKLKYGKIIISCDADCDGKHITLLLLTFFFRYMPDLIRKGHVFSTVAPLFKVLYNNTYEYAMTNEERDKIINRIKNKYKYTVLRYKGLI